MKENPFNDILEKLSKIKSCEDLSSSQQIEKLNQLIGAVQVHSKEYEEASKKNDNKVIQYLKKIVLPTIIKELALDFYNFFINSS